MFGVYGQPNPGRIGDSHLRAARVFWGSMSGLGDDPFGFWEAATVPNAPGAPIFVPLDPDGGDSEHVMRLIARHYYPDGAPGGLVSWQRLRAARAARHRGFTHTLAKRVLQVIDAKISTGLGLEPAGRFTPWSSVAHWPKSTDRLAAYRSGAGDLASLPLPQPVSRPADPECRQLVYGTFETLSEYDLTDDSLVVNPAEGVEARVRSMLRTDALDGEVRALLDDILPSEEGGAPSPPLDQTDADPDTEYNLAFNMSTHGVFVNSSTAEYPLRFLLPHDWPIATQRIRLDARAAGSRSFVGVFYLRYDDAGVRAGMDRFHDVPLPHKFVPLLVFRHRRPSPRGLEGSALHSRYYLYNYAGYQVFWGDFAPRKRILYYELREVMSHLAKRAAPADCWTALRYTGPLDEAVDRMHHVHLLVRKRLPSLDDEERRLRGEAKRGLRPVCLDWLGKSLALEEREDGFCHYDGEDDDVMTADRVSPFTSGQDLSEDLQGSMSDAAEKRRRREASEMLAMYSTTGRTPRYIGSVPSPYREEEDSGDETEDGYTDYEDDYTVTRGGAAAVDIGLAALALGLVAVLASARRSI